MVTENTRDRSQRRLHPATAILLVHGVAPTEVARRAGYSRGTTYHQLQGRLALTRRTFNAIADLSSVAVALDVCAALGVNPFDLPPGWSPKANGSAEADPLPSDTTDATPTAKQGDSS